MGVGFRQSLVLVMAGLLSLLGAGVAGEGARRLWPMCGEDVPPSAPIMAVYTSGYRGECLIHVALYADGRLIWTPGYADLRFPKAAQGSEKGPINEYRVRMALVSPGEAANLVDQVRARKPVGEYKNARLYFVPDLPYPSIKFRSDGEEFELDKGSRYPSWPILLGPDPTPTPPPMSPDQEVFFADWEFLEEQLFCLIELHEEESAEVGPYHFEFGRHWEESEEWGSGIVR